MSTHTLSHLPPDVLERRAEEQRIRIDESLKDLKVSVRETVRERLDVNGLARHHVRKLTLLASVIALAAGYAVAGMFTRH
jgi:hypothetical protein